MRLVRQCVRMLRSGYRHAPVVGLVPMALGWAACPAAVAAGIMAEPLPAPDPLRALHLVMWGAEVAG